MTNRSNMPHDRECFNSPAGKAKTCSSVKLKMKISLRSVEWFSGITFFYNYKITPNLVVVFYFFF